MGSDRSETDADYLMRLRERRGIRSKWNRRARLGAMPPMTTRPMPKIPVRLNGNAEAITR
jgi:hypothetical protein